MSTKALFFLLWISSLGFFGACTIGYFETKEAVTPSEELSNRLLKDILVTIQNNFPPAKTRFHFPHGRERLAQALEGSLRKYGYAVSSAPRSAEKAAVQLAYKFSEIEKGLFVLRVTIGEGFQINRLYSESKDGGFLAAGPLLMRKG